MFGGLGGTRAWLRRMAPWAGLVVLWLAVSVSVGLLGFYTDSRPVTIGAHATEISPTPDGYVTIDLGPVLPRLRLDTDLPLGIGVVVDVQETDARDLNDLLARDALIASQPDGEIRRLHDVVVDMAVDNAIAGAGTGLFVAVLAVLGWRTIGKVRRAELARLIHLRARQVEIRALAIVVAMAIAVAAILVPDRLRVSDVDPTEWQPLRALLPQVRLDPRLDRVEAAAGFSTTGGIGLIRTAVDTYNRSQQLYGDLRTAVPGIASQLRKPGPDQKVALLLSDRHDNIGMDPVVAALAEHADADLVIDAGDDTSSGQRWEAFSINSLAEHFRDYPVVAVAGNHDAGGHIEDTMRRRGFTVLDSKPVEVDGIRFLGDSDPTSTGLGSADTPGDETVQEQSARLADVACDQDEDERIDTLVVHDPSSGAATVARGCASLVVSGHLHRQVGPVSRPADGHSVTTYTNGTTGGAAYAFALGYTLRRPAQVTLVTYTDGAPVGLQPVLFHPSGSVEVGAYQVIG
ncbi:MAG: metallophosphoesterase family protein [Kribbellaceae bacterium]